MLYASLVFFQFFFQFDWRNDTDDNSERKYSNQNYDVRLSLPPGFVKDGSVDYTSYLQMAINRYDNLRFPAFPILVNDDGLKIGSNKVLFFEKGSEIWLKPSAQKAYNILHLRNVENVKIINPIIRGDRGKHLGTVGEWGMGIGIYSSDEITIENAKVYECWGDGIYIGKSGGKPCRNIKIINPYLRNNRRDAISIISVNGLLLENPYAGYSNGTAPMAGINLEPNGPNDELQNITILNPITEYNNGAGITIGMSKLYGKGDKNVSIVIQNHRDKGSSIGFKSNCYPKRKAGAEEVRGNIVINNPTWLQNKKFPIQTALFQKELKLSIYNPTILTVQNKKLSEASMRRILTTKGHINPHANYSITYR